LNDLGQPFRSLFIEVARGESYFLILWLLLMTELTLSCVRLRLMLVTEFELLDEELHTIHAITRWLELFHLFDDATRSSPS